MSAIAELLKENNVITGSDITKSDITKKLEASGIKIFYSHRAENLPSVTDMIIRSASIHDDNPEMMEGKKRGIKVYNRAEVLGQIAKKYKNVITISGSHGKTTTTGLIATCFLNAGLEPTIHIGGILKQIKGNVKIGKNNYFITEACEYVDSFLFIHGNTTVALNVEPDHLDYFKTFDNLKNSFQKYLNNTRPLGLNIINADDNSLQNLKSKRKLISYGINNKYAWITARNLRKGKMSKYSFDVYLKDKKLFRVKMPLVGKHEIYNALACICVCLKYKIDCRIIKNSIERYLGVKRRFEIVCSLNGAEVIHDYAHHPTEIKENINAVKYKLRGKVIVVFQPHTYTRTKALFVEFVNSLCLSNIVFMYKIYPAREPQIPGITSDIISDKISERGIFSKCFNNFYDLKNELKKVARKDDIVLILGAGDIEKFCDYLIDNN